MLFSFNDQLSKNLIPYDFDFNLALFDNDFKVISPELFLVLSTISLLVYGVIGSTSQKKNYPILVSNLAWLAQQAIFFTIILISNNPLTHGVIFYNSLVVDDFTLFFKIVVLCGAFFSILISLDYIKKEGLNLFEFIILILLSTCSMLFLISSLDFISMYLAIEFQSLCFYVMAALKRNSEFSTEAGLKYFLLGAFSSGILLFGCSLIYGFTGVTNFSELGKIFTYFGEPGLRGCELGMIFILVGFLFKLTAVPFHMWAPDVYEGAPTSVTAFFSIAPKVSVLAVFVKLFFSGFYDFMIPWQTVCILSSLASMIWGSLAAMSQNKIKRLLAFSSIGHIGYMLIGICCGTVEGLQALFIYLVIYIVITVNLFAIVLTPLTRDFTHSLQRVKYTTDFAQLGKTNTILAITLTVTMFSIAGIPPLAGFYSKAYLFFAAMSSSQYLLALVGVITSVISCFYYIRIVKIMYFEASSGASYAEQKHRMGQKERRFSHISKSTSIPLGITFFIILFFMIYPSPLYLACHKAALAICL
uniref:NADH dehydrogenase subunit 2 n=1 Tax=Lobosphaera incisa TaxID=312850 RepID=A0A0F7DYI2_9CHLO|nr:NADH dehydrogenase subunit 2 [Lobosphaera incisa]AKF78648.1 NADH dehydrogenase subunit 2 [Lobosphaera incisa]